MKKNGFAPVLILISVLLVVVGGYYFFTKTKTTQESSTWKTYTSGDGEHSFDYPSDWKLIDRSKNVDYDGGFFKEDIELSKGKYIFKSFNPSPTTPALCLFDNEKSEAPSINVSDSIEFSGADIAVYRVGKVGQDLDKGITRWVICKKFGEDFTTISMFGDAGFETPVDYDVQVLETIRKIISSFKSTK
ncbi:MAG: hypothetical protein ABID64_04440 [Nitrospirota bacterium]